jgi:hypothetical protein
MGKCCTKPIPTEDIEFVASSVDGDNWNTFNFPSYTTVGDAKKKLDAWIPGIKSDNMKLTLNGKHLTNM